MPADSALPAATPTLADLSARARPQDVAAAIDEATACLLDRVAVRVDPAMAIEAARGDRPGFILARLIDADRGAPPLGWFAGPIHLAAFEEAARRPDPILDLTRTTPGGDAAVYALAAAARGLPFAPDLAGLEPDMVRLPPPRAAARLAAFRFREPDGRRVLVVAPPPASLPSELDRLAGAPRGSVAVTTPRRLASGLATLVGPRAMEEAVAVLAREDGQLSAAHRPTRTERAGIVALLALVPAALLAVPGPTLAVLHAASALSFLALGSLRLVATAETPARSPPPPLSDRNLPTYTVLVALYGEAAMLTGLVSALERLDYPPDRLRILLLLEEDDLPTIEAARRALTRQPHMEIRVCPPGLPRTKPRALAYGLAFATGELVTVFDAEDRPHPGQLRAAAAAFAAGSDRLACVQARLTVDRVRTGLQRQFALEYLQLFEGLLPWLGARGLPLPLGGTSNHFRRDLLEEVLGWDPYNVTEDADLGVRLARYGYAVDVLDSETREEAPARPGVWLAQRRRWIKGWMVTALVHGRHPRALVREMGVASAVMLPVHALANVGAPLTHPIGLALFALHATGVLPLPLGAGFAGTVLFAAACLSLLFGYAGSMLLASRLAARLGRRDLARAVWLMPAYWLLASAAAWRALYELITAPHRWAKTPHDPHDGDGD